MNDFQKPLEDSITRASDLKGWTIVDVLVGDQEDAEEPDYGWGVGLVLERDGESRRVFFSAVPAAGAQDAWVVLDDRKGMWDHLLRAES